LAIYLLWLGGVPLLAAGLGLQWPAVVSAGASALCVALVLQVVHAVRMLAVVRQTG
jgi:type IV secretory pathway VirB3-like protein